MVLGLRSNVWSTYLTRAHHVSRQKVDLRFTFQDIRSIPLAVLSDPVVYGVSRSRGSSV